MNETRLGFVEEHDLRSTIRVNYFKSIAIPILMENTFAIKPKEKPI